MAYAFESAITRCEPNGLHVLVTETECATTSEATIALGVTSGRVLRHQAALTAGTAATIDPIVGIATDPSAAAATVVVENDVAAATIDNVQPGGVPYYVEGGTLYLRSRPNAGADNSVTTRLFIALGSW